MALGTQAVGKLLDYEQYIEHQLKRTRARIKMIDVLTAVGILSTGAIALLFVEILLDHIFGLPLLLREIVLVASAGVAAVFAFRQILLPLISQVNGLYAARTIEGVHPTFKNSLLNYLHLRKHKENVSKAFMAAVEAKAVKDLTDVEVEAVVNQDRMQRVVYVLAAIMSVFVIYAALTPKSPYDSARRALLFDIARPTNTQFVNIKPGDYPELSRVVTGANVPFSVDVKGVRPEKVLLHASIDGGKFYSITEFAPGANLYDPWQTTLRDVRHEIKYYVTGGDGESRRYDLTVDPAPMVLSVTHDLQFPEYTGVPARPGVEGGSIEAIEGTTVTIHAHHDKAGLSSTRATVNPGPVIVRSGLTKFTPFVEMTRAVLSVTHDLQFPSIGVPRGRASRGARSRRSKGRASRSMRAPMSQRRRPGSTSTRA